MPSNTYCIHILTIRCPYRAYETNKKRPKKLQLPLRTTNRKQESQVFFFSFPNHTEFHESTTKDSLSRFTQFPPTHARPTTKGCRQCTDPSLVLSWKWWFPFGKLELREDLLQRKNVPHNNGPSKWFSLLVAVLLGHVSGPWTFKDRPGLYFGLSIRVTRLGPQWLFATGQ